MDFDFTPRQESFRQEVRAWLAENVPADLRGRGFASSRADVKEVRRLLSIALAVVPNLALNQTRTGKLSM